MTVTIAKEFTFEAAHCVPTFPEHHKCRRMHGHSYTVELRFVGPVEPSGLCAGIDYADIAAVWNRVAEKIDHRVLNDVAGLEIPTTEVLAQWIGRQFKAECGAEHVKMLNALSIIRLSEAVSTWCEVVVS